jgi:hypothetical protein
MRSAFSVLELVVMIVVMALALNALTLIMSAGRKQEEVVSSHLGLQLESQKALMQLIRELQEGIAVVLPLPGNTLPMAVVRDKLDRLAVYTVVPGAKAGEYRLRADLASPRGVERAFLFGGIKRLTFSALSDSALMLHAVLLSGGHETAFTTEIRLRNRDAAEVE